MRKQLFLFFNAKKQLFNFTDITWWPITYWFIELSARTASRSLNWNRVERHFLRVVIFLEINFPSCHWSWRISGTKKTVKIDDFVSWRSHQIYYFYSSYWNFMKLITIVELKYYNKFVKITYFVCIFHKILQMVYKIAKYYIFSVYFCFIAVKIHLPAGISNYSCFAKRH